MAEPKDLGESISRIEPHQQHRAREKIHEDELGNRFLPEGETGHVDEHEKQYPQGEPYGLLHQFNEQSNGFLIA